MPIICSRHSTTGLLNGSTRWFALKRSCCATGSGDLQRCPSPACATLVMARAGPDRVPREQELTSISHGLQFHKFGPTPECFNLRGFSPDESSIHDLARGHRRDDGLVDSIVVGAELGEIVSAAFSHGNTTSGKENFRR